MWLSSRRHALLLLAAAPMAGCGFTPLYGEGSAARAAQGRIDVTQISGLMGFKLRERLTTRLGAASAPTHRLSVSVRTTSQELAINPQNEITRYSLTGTATFDLRDRATNASVLKDKVRAFAAYSATASAYATTVAERDARERLAHALAEQIATRIAGAADRWLA